MTPMELYEVLPQYPKEMTLKELSDMVGQPPRIVANRLKNILSNHMVCEDDGKYSRCDEYYRRLT